MSTIRDVAKLAGVSVSTVSRVINQSGYVNKETEEKVREAIEKLDYKPNTVARGLVNKKTKTIALIIPDITNPFFPKLARAIEDTVNELGYSVILGNTDGSSRKRDEYIHIMKNRYVDGMIFASHPLLEYDMEDLKQIGMPYVIVGGVKNSYNEFLNIGTDNFNGAVMAVEHLLEIGCKHIAHISGPKDKQISYDRYLGYKQTLEKRGMFNSDYIMQGYYDIDSGQKIAKLLLESYPQIDGIFAANDLMALGALNTLINMKKRVPQDVALIGFDDIPLIGYTVPSISTIAQPVDQIGRVAVQRLIGLIENKKEFLTKFNNKLQPKLICRESTDREKV